MSREYSENVLLWPLYVKVTDEILEHESDGHPIIEIEKDNRVSPARQKLLGVREKSEGWFCYRAEKVDLASLPFLATR